MKMRADKLKFYQRRSKDFGGRFACVNLENLNHNCNALQAFRANHEWCFCVKSNAYGHGLQPIVNALQNRGYFSICDLQESNILLGSRMNSALVLFNLDASLTTWKTVAKRGCIGVVYTLEQLQTVERLKAPVKIWLKINTGMNRLGIDMRLFTECIQRIKNTSHITLLSVMSHFGCAGEPNGAVHQRQLEHLKTIVQKSQYPLTFENSTSLLEKTAPFECAQIIRTGIALYGACSNPINLKLVMSVWCSVLQIQTLKKGDGLGYGARWVAKKNSKIAVVNFGYSDGFVYTSNPKNVFVTINGQKFPVVGAVSMNSLYVDVSDCLDVQINDLVCLWSSTKDMLDLSNALGVIPYYLLTSINHARVPFYYEH